MAIPLSILLSGCPSVIPFLSDAVPALIPSVNLNNININTNQITCYQGGMFSSDYCSIPLSRFVALMGKYTDFANTNLLIAYDMQNNQKFFFDELHYTGTIDKLNKIFMDSYPSAHKFALMPHSVQSLYIKMRERYIPQHDYERLYRSYTYLYTISAIKFATDDCNMPINYSNLEKEQYILYKAFAIQYTNAVLYYVGNHISTSYNNELDAYNSIYKKILTINPSKLQNLANNIFDNTNSVPQITNFDLFSESGVTFGDIGSFKCSQNGNTWFKYGYEYFGTNISGIDTRIEINVKKDLSNTSSKNTGLIYNSIESKNIK